MSEWRADHTAGFRILDVFAAPLGDPTPLNLPPDADDTVLLCEDGDGFHWTVATSRKVADAAMGRFLPASGTYAHPEWPSEWQERLQLDADTVEKLTKRLELKRVTLVLSLRAGSRAAEDAAVDAHWNELEAVDAGQFEERWTEALERGRE